MARTPRVAIQADPELRPEFDIVRVGSGMEETSITVIENPSLDGYCGILLATHFRQGSAGWHLLDVQHVRIDDDNSVSELKWYGGVKIGMGHTYAGDKEIVYRRASSGSIKLPAPSAVPYKLCFVPPEEYERFLAGLISGRWKETVEPMYRMLGENVPGFAFKRGGLFRHSSLILPEDYASLRLDGAR